MRRLTSAYHVVFNEHNNFHHALRRKFVTFDEVDLPEYDPIGVPPRQYYQENRDAGHDYDGVDTDSRPERSIRRPRQRDDNPIDSEQRGAITDPSQPDYSPAADPKHGTDQEWSENHCRTSGCTLLRGHTGPCDTDDTHGHRLRPRPVRHYTEWAVDKSRQCKTSEHCTYAAGHDGMCSSDELRKSRKEVARKDVYFGCSSNDCVYHADHKGLCVDKSGAKCAECKDDDGDAATVIGDWSDWSDIDEDEFCDYDHLNVVIDDVTGQCLKMDVQPQSDIKEPTKYDHAIVGPLGPRWISSMREE